MKLAVRLIAGIASAACSLAAAQDGWDWRYTLPVDAATYRAADLFVADDGAVWRTAVPVDGTRANSIYRHSPDGSSREMLQRQTALQSSIRHVAPDADGGAYLVAYAATAGGPVTFYDSAVQRLTRDGAISWTRTFGFISHWSLPVRDGVWIQADQSLRRLGTDGVTRAEISRTTVERPELVAADKASGSLVALAQTVAGGQTSKALARFDRTGKKLWSVTPMIAGRSVAFDYLHLAADGDVIAAGRADSDGAGALIRVSATGTMRWSKLHPATIGRRFSRIDTTADAIYLTATNDTDHVLYRLSNAGDVTWSRTVATLAECPAACPLVVGIDGTLSLLTVGANSELRRFDRAGTPAPPVSLPSLAKAAVASDGTFVTAASPAAGAVGEVDSYRINAAGQVVATYRQPALQGRPVVWWSSFDADGDTFALTGAQGSTVATLTRLDSHGQVRWQRVLDARVAVYAIGAKNDETLCFTAPDHFKQGQSTVRVHCFRTLDGSAIWSREIAAYYPDWYFPSTVVLPDSSVQVLHANTTGTLQVHAFSAAGAPKPLAELATPVLGTPRGANGFTAYVYSSSGNPPRTSISLVDSAGRLRYNDYSGFALDFNHWSIGRDGSVVIVGRTATVPSETVARLIDASGRYRWSTPLPGMGEASPLILDGSNVYFIDRASPSISGRWRYTLWSLSQADGAIRWKTDLGLLSILNARIAVRNGQVIVASGGDPIGLRRIDDATGQLIAEEKLPCGHTWCPVFDMALDADGGLRVLSRLESMGGRTQQVIFHADRPALPRTAVRADQPGISGAWWTTYGNGEGLVLDWLPDSRTLFMPWFTFGLEAVGDPSGQRWYTVAAGGVPAGATRVDMDIRASDGGRFVAAGGVVTTRVGSAALTFESCDKATLSYQFDSGEKAGIQGSLALSRLSAAGADCVLADGSTRPGTDRRPPAGGFDSRMSGSWYDPEKPGQGMQFAIQPGGVLFAPWFTYDVDNTADDAMRQHWFVLSGNLAGASGGRATVAIVQAIGGAFDRIPTGNFVVVGSATVTMTACDRANVSYRFDSAESAGPYAGKAGTISLVKVGVHTLIGIP
ncbi:hypothetical protein [Tahibacter amnicola]|uniref:Outer membrane protein assembly factor BamB n=1 Tax=Tahibacter amnicola TaxID=2976241 RepID=A0ABY6BII9_9GAMM|nr:hypothetical protein [Tahibacter amnicola]UXI69322.1 hypothetical protein N4264_06645 [Tahibacter amnicola]